VLPLLLHPGLLHKPQALPPGRIIYCQLNGIDFFQLKTMFQKSFSLTLMEQCNLGLIQNNKTSTLHYALLL
jgi:hypothetical protein